MRRDMVSLTLAVGLWLGALSAWAGVDQRQHPADAFPSDVASAWFDLLYGVVKTEQLSPPVASRIYGLAVVTLYEAVVPGSREHRSLVGQLNDLTAVPQPQPHTPYHWPTVAHSALARAVRGLFPHASQSSLDAIHALEHALTAEFQASVPPLVSARSVAQGRAVARAVLAWASTDGFTTLNNCPSTPPVGPGLWVPTPPAFAPNPLQPCWGQLRPLVLPSSDACALQPPPRYATDPASAPRSPRDPFADPARDRAWRGQATGRVRPPTRAGKGTAEREIPVATSR